MSMTFPQKIGNTIKTITNKPAPVGIKHDENKNRLDLIDVEFIEGIGEVLTFGAEKYAPNSWQNVEDGVNRYYGATLRHLFAWRKGEKKDPESGKSHLLHIACNMMFLLYHEMKEEK